MLRNGLAFVVFVSCLEFSLHRRLRIIAEKETISQCISFPQINILGKLCSPTGFHIPISKIKSID